VVRRNKPTALTPQEINRIVADAGRLIDALRRPLISTQCEHYKAIARLTETLLAVVQEITGESAPPWGRIRPSHETVAAPWSK
jgi:hypothetical protein